MQNDSSGLTRLQGKAIEGLITTNTRAAAADYAGCSERSIYKWLSDPIFKSVLLDRENQLRREAGRRLAMSAKQAIDTIKEILADTHKDPGLRLRAADLLLKYMQSTQDQTELEQRVTRLEAKQPD
jgi:hypothetical protein